MFEGFSSMMIYDLANLFEQVEERITSTLPVTSKKQFNDIKESWLVDRLEEMQLVTPAQVHRFKKINTELLIQVKRQLADLDSELYRIIKVPNPLAEHVMKLEIRSKDVYLYFTRF